MKQFGSKQDHAARRERTAALRGGEGDLWRRGLTRRLFSLLLALSLLLNLPAVALSDDALGADLQPLGEDLELRTDEPEVAETDEFDLDLVDALEPEDP